LDSQAVQSNTVEISDNKGIALTGVDL